MCIFLRGQPIEADAQKYSKILISPAIVLTHNVRVHVTVVTIRILCAFQIIIFINIVPLHLINHFHYILSLSLSYLQLGNSERYVKSSFLTLYTLHTPYTMPQYVLILDPLLCLVTKQLKIYNICCVMIVILALVLTCI